MKPITERNTVGEVLELSANPTYEEIKANYKRLMKTYHPDVNKTLEALEYVKKINRAYAIATGKEQVPIQQPTQPQVVIIRYGFTYTSGGTTRVGGWY